MAKALLSSVLEAQLGKYVDGLSGDSLQVGLWSGELTLRGLALKPLALAELDLPVRVVRGAVERVRVVVPWDRLGSASVRVELEGVTALVAPSEGPPSAAERRQAAQTRLARLELARRHARFTARAHLAGEDEGSFLSRLAARIADNLQVTLRNVHLRFEDAAAVPERPFACGLMLGALRLRATDADGRDAFLDRAASGPSAAFSHRALSLERVGFYWDRLARGNAADGANRLLEHEDAAAAMLEMLDVLVDVEGGDAETTGRHGTRSWVLRPLSVAVQLTKNEGDDYSAAARLAVRAQVEALACGVSREQYEDFMFLYRAFLGRRVVEAHMASARRRPFHSAADRPRDWWDYAARLVRTRRPCARGVGDAEGSDPPSPAPTQLQPPQPRRLRMRWSSVSRSLAELRLYVEAFRMELRAQAPLDADSKHGQFKAQYEDTYPADVVMAARDYAEDQELREAERKKRETERAAAAGAQQGGASWYSYFFGGAAETSGDAEGALDGILTAEGRADLKEAYDQDVLKETRYKVPSGCNLLSVKLQLARGSLELFQAGERRPFVSATLTGSLAVNVQPLDEWDARFRLQHFEILNASAQGTPFHTFCTLSPSASEAAKRLPCLSLDAGMKRAIATETKATEPDAMALKVRLSCMPIRLMADPLFVLSLHHFFVSLLPDEQLDKVWQFATSSVSEWIFASDDGDDDAVLRSIDADRREMLYDVLVDVNAPVIVVPENAFEPTGAVLVLDFGKLSFTNDSDNGASPTEGSSADVRQLSWRLAMTDVHVLLGDRTRLNWTDVELQQFARLVEELSLDLSVKTLQQSRIKYPSHERTPTMPPQLEVRANVPRVSVSLSEEQLVALGRIHSSIIAAGKQVAESNPVSLVLPVGSGDDGAVASGDAHSGSGVAVHPAAGKSSAAAAATAAEKLVMRMQIFLGEIVVNVRETAAKDAFLMRLQQISLDSSVFTSHYTVEAKLKSLMMHDKLHSSRSTFFELISTGSSTDQDLISLNVLGFTSTATSAVVEQLGAEASRVAIGVRCNVLDVQWNPSSMALLYRIGSAYVTALNFYSEFDDFEDALEVSPAPGSPERVPERSSRSPGDLDGAEHEGRREDLAPGQQQVQRAADAASLPAILLRASLVQFSITFNKDQANRQLVRLAMKNSAVEVSSHVVQGAASGEEEQTTLRAAGHVGNFVMTDMGKEKHPIYAPLVGLDEREVHLGGLKASSEETTPSTTQALVEFAFTAANSAAEKSTLRLDFRPIRVVYFHQQVLELVDYLLEGVMGAMVNQTLANATQLLLSTDESSVIFQLSITKPSLILPLRTDDANHLKVTADTLKLEHFPSSVVRYGGSGPADQRTKTVVKRATSLRAVEPGSVRADCKDIGLVQARILCTRESGIAGSDGASLYADVLEEPIDLVIRVEDLISADVRLKNDAAFLPRFTIESEIDEVKIGLSRTSYLSFIALFTENFGADEIADGSATKLTAASGSSFSLFGSVSNEDETLRPTVNYAYMDPNADLVTMRTLFAIRGVSARLLDEEPATSRSSSSPAALGGLVDQAFGATIASASSAFAALTADQFSFASAQLRDCDPRIEIRIGALAVRDLAGEYLEYDNDSGNKTGAIPEVLGQRGSVMLCEMPTKIVYSWSETEATGQLDLKLSQVTGIVIPEALMGLTDFFTLPTKPSSGTVADETKRLGEVARQSDQAIADGRRGSGGLSPSGNRSRRQSITEILLEAHSPELALTVNLEATRVGIAVPADCCDPMSPQISCVADFTVLYTWKPKSASSNGDDDDDQATSDFDIQSSLMLDARTVEVAVANANRQGCCVPRETSGDSVGTDTATLIQIIEPCELHVEISDLFPHAGQKQQIIALRFTPIDVFVSHDDVCLALETVERLNESVQRYNTRKRLRSKAKCASDDDSVSESALEPASGGILSPRAFQSSMGKDAAVGLEVHRYLTLEMTSVCLTLINDCDGCDMGLAQFQLERCNLFLNVTYDEAQTRGKMFGSPPATTISGGGSVVVLMAYYNPDTRDWHPMCAEWSMDLAVQGCVYLDSLSAADADTDGDTEPTRPGENELHVILTANHPLEVTVTHGLLEVVASAGGAWKRRASGLAAVGSPPDSPTTANSSPRASREAREQRKHAPCVVRNETGVAFEFWLTNGRANTARQVVHSGDIADVRYTHTVGRGSGVVRKYASAEREAANMRLCVQLADASFQPVQGIIFEQLGSRAFPLVDVSGRLSSFSLNCYAKLVDGRILLSVSSQVKVVNRLSMPIQLLVNDPTWRAPVEIGVLQPFKESAVPLLASLGTELRVRPATRDGESPFDWSAPIPVQQRSEVSLKVEAAATGGGYGYGSSDVRSAVFAVSLSVEQSLRVVSLSEPIVLVNKLPVPLTFAIRNVASAGASSSKGETVAVGAKCGVWWTDQQQRPQFRLDIDGCQPSKWMELLHPRTKMGTVMSVMLERMDGRPFKMLLQVVEDSATKAVHLVLYAEIWFVNRTGLELIYGNESDAEAYMPPFEARALVGNAQICAYSTFGDGGSGSSGPAVRVGMASCQWSTRFVADPRRLSWQDEVVTMRGGGGGSAGAGMLYEFGVSADYATRHFGSITTLVSFFPRYLVMNHTAHTVLLYEDAQRSRGDSGDSDGNVAHHVLAPGDTYALYWVTGARSKVRVSVLGELEYEWSGSFSVDHPATSDMLVPERGGARWGGKGTRQTAGVPLQVVIKRGSISQSTMVVVINEASLDEDSARGSVAAAASGAAAHPTWDRLSIHAQVAGVVVTIADKKESDANLFGATSALVASDEEVEEVARLTVSRISLEASATPEQTSAKMNLSGLKLEDLLPQSKNPVVLCPVSRAGDYRGAGSSKYFLEMTYLEKPHAKYKWLERIRVELQDVRVTTSMRFIDRLNRLLKETVSHFERRSYSASSEAASAMLQGREEDARLLQYFVPTASEDDASMTSITGRKIYVEECEVAPVRVIVSFSRGKGDVQRPDPGAGFWLANLKLKIENASLVLGAFKLSRAMGTQEALAASLVSFYEQSAKSQALGLIDSIQVTSLVTSVVAGGVTSLVSTLLGKTDPSLAAASGFRHEPLANTQIVAKHSRALAACRSPAQLLEQVKHLVFDWDSNHTGLGARGCVALALVNNSRHSLVVNAQLRDGAELHVLPLGRRRLASALDAGRGDWRSERAVVLFAFGYTPTPLTSGDVYFEVRSNACDVFVTRKTARLKANLGYSATLTHQESQQWWAANVAIIGDDLRAAAASSSSSSSNVAAGGLLRQTAPPEAAGDTASLFGAADRGGGTSTYSAVRRSSTMGDARPARQAPAAAAAVAAFASSSSDGDEEYEVTFSGQALGIVAKQSGRAVVVRECTSLPSGAPGPALASGRISPGDLILSVSGATVVSTTQFRELVRTGPRPLVLRLRASGARFSAACDLFGEAPSASQTGGGGAGAGDGTDDGFDLFGVGR